MKNETIILFMKAKIAIPAVIITLAAFFAPLKPLILLIGLFIFGDSIFGMIRAKKVGEELTSRRFSKIVSKMLLYQLAILSFFALDILVLGDLISLFFTIPFQFLVTKIVALMLITIELQSIRENIKIAYGVDIWDKVKNLIQRGQQIKKGIEDAGLKKKD
jgi:hypothetical protein